MKRLRLLHLKIEPVLVIDDGDTLIPAPAKTVIVPADQLEGFAADFERQRQAAEDQLNPTDDRTSA